MSILMHLPARPVSFLLKIGCHDKPLIDLTFSGPCVVILEIGCSCKDLSVLGQLLVSDNQLALSLESESINFVEAKLNKRWELARQFSFCKT